MSKHSGITRKYLEDRIEQKNQKIRELEYKIGCLESRNMEIQKEADVTRMALARSLCYCADADRRPDGSTSIVVSFQISDQMLKYGAHDDSLFLHIAKGIMQDLQLKVIEIRNKRHYGMLRPDLSGF